MSLRFARLDPRATLPSRAHPGDAGLDLCALEAGDAGPRGAGVDRHGPGR